MPSWRPWPRVLRASHVRRAECIQRSPCTTLARQQRGRCGIRHRDNLSSVGWGFHDYLVRRGCSLIVGASVSADAVHREESPVCASLGQQSTKQTNHQRTLKKSCTFFFVVVKNKPHISFSSSSFVSRQCSPREMRDAFQRIIHKDLRPHHQEAKSIHSTRKRRDDPAVPRPVLMMKQRITLSFCQTNAQLCLSSTHIAHPKSAGQRTYHKYLIPALSI